MGCLCVYRWIAQWVCDGTRNLRSGIESALGCVEWAGSLVCPKESVGVYLITGGLPDQEEVQWAGLAVRDAMGHQPLLVFAAGAAL